jgi:hypothetical protein
MDKLTTVIYTKEDYKEFKQLIKFFEKTDYYLNPDSTLYMGRYIGKYVQMVFDSKRLPTLHKSQSYWSINLKGKEFKVKHISSCLNSDMHFAHWHYAILYDKKVDAFLLSAFDSTDSLVPEHLWFVLAKDQLNVERCFGEFWNRATFEVHYTNKNMEIMKKYELTSELEKLKKVMVVVKTDLEKDRNNDVRRIIISKRNEILKKTGYKMSTREIIEKAIKIGLEKI